MFPLRDTIKSRTFPIATYGLIVINVIVFLFETSLTPERFDDFLQFLGMVPANFYPFRPLSVITLFTSVFLHGSWFHLISNMWTLFIFGDNVEDRMGTVRYVVFYLLTGLTAGLVHAFVTIISSGAESFNAQAPTVGASGAIAGVLGAYFLLYPRAKVKTSDSHCDLPLVCRYPRDPVPRILVLRTAFSRTSQPERFWRFWGCLWRHCLVGTRGRVHVWPNYGEFPCSTQTYQEAMAGR